jgi:4-hydroxy-tetrahydrodipicolinate synthase
MLKLSGVYPIVPTPFTDDGELDLESLARLVAYLLEVGVSGLALLGFLGEVHKLSAAERRRVIEVAVAQAGGRIQVLVGVRALGAADAVEQAQAARDLGADAVFVAPIDVQDDRSLYSYFSTVAARSPLPVLIHDFPEEFRTKLSPDLIARLGNEVDDIIGIKLEDTPVLVKLSRLLELAPTMQVLGGLGGMYFVEELRRGSVGIMTGFAFPQLLVDIFRLHGQGRITEAVSLFDAHSSLIRYEFQPKIGLAFRKYVYKARGIFDSDMIRDPGLRLDERSRAELVNVIERCGLAL